MKQKRQSYYEGFREDEPEEFYAYRENLKANCPIRCAAGIFIPDDKYNPEMETHPFNEVNTEFNLGFNDAEVNLINEFQKVHDRLYRDWETDRKSTRLNSSHITRSRMPSSA